MSTKEIQYRESATLLCLLAGLSGKIITVEQLNENKITGKIENVDENMTLQLSNVEIVDIEEQVTHFDALQVPYLLKLSIVISSSHLFDELELCMIQCYDKL